jgi:hypothetical protein
MAILIDRTVDGFHARVVQHECDTCRASSRDAFGLPAVRFYRSPVPDLDPSQDD